MNNNTRKCNACKKLIDISEMSSDDYFFRIYGKTKQYFHSECYIEQQMNRKRNPMTREECLTYISERKSENVEQNIEKKKEQKINAVKDQLYDFIADMYDISFFPTFFYIKMNTVYKGTYKGLKKSVPPEDLLDMWEQKKNYLLKVYERNRTQGKEMEGLQRVYYDLAILLSKYDSYLNWKDKQKIAQSDIRERENRTNDFISQKIISQNKPNNPNSHTVGNKEIDINSILDDI